MEPIAIIGLAHRFPGGANTPAKLWEVLNSRRDLSREPDPDRLNLQKFHHANGEHHGSSNVTKSYFLEEDPRLFDTTFFNVSPLEAEAMDPQQRLLLETVYEATESAGTPIERFQGSRCSVFVGVMTGDYETIQYRDTEDLSHYTASGTSRAILANRISYFFDLSGSSICLDTACSSSLVAMHLAVQDLRSGAAETAVVAGTNLIFGPDMYISESKLRMLSPTGKCQMWDAMADGYARGEGVAALLLKPLSKALRDNDPIQAVIRNSGVNSDGRTPGITMPSAMAQAKLTTETYRAAGLDPSKAQDRCQYFEAHGTGTQAGDPTEARGIFESFFAAKGAADTEVSPLFVGSVKTVVGHLEGCAGLAGVIKVLLAMKHDTIPPNLHLRSLNPKIQPYKRVLKVPTEPTPWPDRVDGQPKRASVNSFGFGGTNAHVILESYEPKPETRSLTSGDIRFTTPFCVSAHSQTSLLENIRRLTIYIHNNPNVSLDDIAWTLWQRRSGLGFRKSFHATSRKDLLASLEKAIADSAGAQPSLGTPAASLVSPSEGFGVLGIFTGQGAQWPGMGKDLLTHSPVFRAAIEECDVSLSKLPDAPSWSLKQQLLADPSQSRISEAEIAQPATTAVEIGLARMLQTSGIKFSAVVGHSSGEIAALYAAGILSLSDAIRVAFYRGVYAKLAGTGSMMAVGISGEAAQDFCREAPFKGRICLAAKNSPSSVTLSGDVDAIQEAKEVFDNRKIFARVLKTDKAYHSPHMEACSEAYLKAMRKCGISPLKTESKCVWVSSVDGTASRYWDQNFDDLSGPYWIANMVKPVLFADAVTMALTNGGPFDAAIEVGPHPALKGPVNQTVRPHLGKQLPYCGSMNRGEDCVVSMMQLQGFLWSHFGAQVLDLDQYQRCWYDEVPTHKVVDNLPTYCWDHGAPIWRESRLSRNHRLRSSGNESILLGHRCPDDSDWEPRWRNFLSLKELPWLRGHSFQGEVLFPSAGYVAMMLEVAQFLSGDKPMSLIEIKKLTLERPLKVEEGPRPVEMLTSVKVTRKDERKITAEFSSYVCSDASTGKVDRTCFGSISVSLGGPMDDILPPRVDPLAATVPPVDVERFYSSVKETRLEYEDLFKRLNSMRRVDGIATATASWFADEIEYGNLYHPALIDVALQPVFAAFNAPTAERLWTAYLPQSFEKITVNPRHRLVPSSGGQIEVLIDAFSTELSATKISGDVSIFSPHDDFKTPFLQLEGMALAALGRPDASNDRIIFAETKWEADLLGGAEFEIDFNPPQDVAVEESERVALFFCRKLLAEASKVGVENLKPHEKMMFEQLTDLANTVEKGPYHNWAKDTRETIDAILERNQDQVDFELLRLVGDEAGSVFRNEKQMVHVLFADDKLSHFYREGLGLRNAQRQVSAYLNAISHRYPKANILEIGAGTGATTSAVFDTIGDHFGSYTFTDVSLAFFPEAQKRFANHVHKMTFKKLDIGHPFEEQGFDTPSYDVIIAANVLHVSDDIEAVLRRVRGLLKPGGFLIVTEPTSDHLRIQVIMGGLEGWWLARDSCRRFGPVATIETWDEKLRNVGFTGVDMFSHDQKEDELHTFTSFVSQATDHTINALREPLVNTHMIPDFVPFTLIGGSTFATSKTVRSVKDRLSGYGNDVVHFTDLRSVKASDVPANTLVLCLSELDQPTFKSGVDDAALSGFKSIIEKARGVLIFTKNAATSNPYSNMLVGLCRGLRAEKPALGSFLQVMDIDGATKLDPNTILQHFLQLTLSSIQNTEPGERFWSLETELCLRNNQLFVPRIQEYEDPNERTNSARRQIVKEVTSETHVIEVNKTETSIEVRASSKLIQDRPRLDTIENAFSCLAPINLLSYQVPQYLCVGTRKESSEAVIALSPTNTSLFQVSSESVLSASIASNAVALLSVVLAAQAWVRSVPRGHTIWLHGMSKMAKDVIEVEAKKNGIEIFASSPDSTCDGFIPPRAPTRMLKAFVPRKTAAIIFGDSIRDADSSDLLSKVSSFLLVRNPSNGHFWECPASQSDRPASQLLEAAYASTIQLNGITEDQTAKIVPIGDLCEVEASVSTTVIDWRQAQSVPIRADLQPVKPEQLFKSDKTYFMVGLTGDVGISICSWMIKHGVQYVVLASRNPNVSQTWIDSMTKLGAKVLVMAMDVTNPDRIKEIVDEISKTMPPIAGVCNGSMVLSDKLFMQMDVESVQTALRPKVDGSIHLDRAFSGQDLDFFIMLSSTGSVIGTPGQSNYHMANTFMAGLAADRRRRGLAGSVIDVGMISDTGYVTRQDPIVAKKLRSMCVLALCEAEVHVMFAEGILAGRPGFSSHSELIAGLAISDNEAERPFWANEPRFGFYVRDKRDSATENIGTSVLEDLRAALDAAADEETVFTKVREAFAQRLESLLQLPQGSAKMDLPLVSLGLDSLLAMEVQTWFRKVVGAEVSVLQILSGASGDSICKAASAPIFANKSSNPVKKETSEAETKPETKRTQLSVPVLEVDGASTPITPDNRTTPGTPDASPPTPMTSVGSESRDEQTDGYFKERKIHRVVHRRAQMSFAQARLWFLQGFLEDPTTYNETSMYELSGPLDVDRLKNAFRQVTWHHEILRTYFYTDSATGLPMQAVTATSACPFKFVDGATDVTIAQEYQDMKSRQWDLEEGVCLGLTVLRHASDCHTLILSSHHIAIDGVTWILLLKDLARAYEGKSLPTIPQYVDFAVKQRSMVEHGNCAKETQFWKDELAGLPDALPLFPMSHTKTRKATNQYATTIVDTVLPKDLVSRIKQVSSKLHVTPFHFHFAVLASMVSRLSQTNDFCIGTVDTGRSGTEFSQTAGCFINIVPVRVNMGETDSFETLCKHASSKILASLTNSTIPLDALLDELQVPRTARHSPIFQVIINYRLGILGLNSIGDAALKYVQSQSSGNPYDLGVNITDAPDGTCLLHFAVQDALYSKEAAQSILDCYRCLLESACAAPRSEVAELPMHRSFILKGVGESDGQGLTGRGRRFNIEWSGTISHRIDEVADHHLDLVAIKDGEKVYTYREMMQKVNNLVASLRALGVPRSAEPFCCLLIEPSAEYVFAYLAVLKVGAIVVSLDTTNHQERLASIVGDCKPQVILHDKATSHLAQLLADSSHGTSTLEVSSILSRVGDHKVRNSSDPHAPAVLFYTSGTTGIPKGAILKHRNYVNLIEASSRRLQVRPKEEVILQQTGVSFDLCPFEIFTAFSNAATLVMASKDQRRDPSAIVDLIKSEKVTLMAGTPVEFKHIFQHASDVLKTCENFQTVAVGGEIFTPQLAAQFKQAMPPGANVFNVYGPTETCIFATVECVNYLEDGLDFVPAGPALDNVSIYVVDDRMNLVPEGCAGEVCIGGAGVSQGYLRRQELTNKSFVSDPFATADDQGNDWKMMYRTGDSGYLKQDGSLVILGRISGDSQVKIRGIRIELEDIASNILKTANGKLAEAVVTVRGEDKTLVAFAVIATDAQIKDTDGYLRSLPASLPLPEYMRPSIIIPLQQLPMNHNGKLDRAALNKIPIPAQAEESSQETLTPLERDLRQVWEQILPDTISQSTGILPNSDFFRLGGNSLLLVNLRKKVQKQWQISVPLLHLFEASNLRSMAAMIRGAKESKNDGIDWEFWDEQTRFDGHAAIEGVSAAPSHVVPRENKTVVLTGAAKGLGSWLLKLLLDDPSVGKVHCIAISQEQVPQLPASDKLVIHIGSLADPTLGLSGEAQQTLKRDVDIMIHAGAEGSCLNNYDSIRVQNVESTKFVANLALARKVPFHYISSPRVILFSGGNTYPERPISVHYPPAALGREGFTSTKWASETYLEKCAAATGLPVSIHRAGYLMSEDADEMDAVNMIHKYSAILKAVPSLATFSGFLDMCKLPTTAGAILQSLTNDDFGVSYGATRIIHHTEGNVVPVHEFQSYMEARFGHSFKSMSMVDWATEAEEKGMSAVLAAFLEAVVERGDEARYPRLLRGSEQD